MLVPILSLVWAMAALPPSSSFVLMTKAGCFPDLDLAIAIDTQTDNPRERSVLVALFRFEGQCDAKAIGDHGTSFGAFQIHGRGRQWEWLLGDVNAQVRTALDMVRQSFRACSRLPRRERLGVYARGRCDSERGRELSRSRMALAERIER